jgi:hypothetical protein
VKKRVESWNVRKSLQFDAFCLNLPIPCCPQLLLYILISILLLPCIKLKTYRLYHIRYHPKCACSACHCLVKASIVCLRIHILLISIL